MTTAPSFDLQRTMSGSGFQNDFDNLQSFTGGHNDEWSHINVAVDSEDPHPAGSGRVNYKFRHDIGSNENGEPETPLRRGRGNSLSTFSGTVTPQSVGRSFSLSSLSYTPLDHSFPSPADTPLGTPLELPPYNPFDTYCDPKMSQWDLSAVPNYMQSANSTVNLSSLHQNLSLHDDTFGLPGVGIDATKPASAVLSRKAARSSSVSSIDLRKMQGASANNTVGTRKPSVSSGVNPFYCPPPCLLETKDETNVLPRARSCSASSAASAGTANHKYRYSKPQLHQPSPQYQHFSTDVQSSFGPEFSEVMPTNDSSVKGDAGISSNECSTTFFEDPIFSQVQPSDEVHDMGLSMFPLKSISVDSSFDSSFDSSVGDQVTDPLNMDVVSKPLMPENLGFGTRKHSSSITSNRSSQSDGSVDKAKPFVCDLCSKGFRRMEHLRRHTKTHTRERPYTCSVPDCGRKFSRSDNLKAHILTHAKRTGRNKYVEALADLPIIQSRKKRNSKNLHS